MNFTEKLARAVKKNNSLLCVGLDPDVSELPDMIKHSDESLFEFNKAIIDATADLVCAFKPNSAFYEATGEKGIAQLQKTCAYIRAHYPEIPILLDFKRGDIGNTNNYYAQFAFDYLGVDAITVNPYLGRKANEAFLAYKDKGIMILCRTSDPGAEEFQDLVFDGKKLYEIVAEHVASGWNNNNNCLLVLGATYPTELGGVRKLLGDKMTFLSPGVGAQKGALEQTIKTGTNSEGSGLIINSSRSTLYASSGSDFAEAARKQAQQLRDDINKYR